MDLIVGGVETRGDFAERINGDFQEPVGVIHTEEDYLLSLAPLSVSLPREIARLPPVVPGIILSMIARNEGVMVWLGYPTPAG